ncbi:bleomycin resistance protein [Kribbella deserti]|uniref:Bleomycin resistance protein n=1 Tax=Kribbella deserti TaxID=1926257 RepID=A0ABV6QSQ0_9ACTN
MSSVSERTIPILPCRDLDDVVPFYTALGFTVTYRQARPNPYLCLRRGGIDLHFAGIAEFDPESSLGNVLVVVPDIGALYDEFAAGLRAAYGKLPMSGLPRITRPRRKQGTTGGFSVVDPGGNWLRVTSAGETEENEAPAGRLDRVLLNAARQGDARGNVPAAITVLEAGLTRHLDASAAERLPVLVYLAELHHRAGDSVRALETLAAIDALDLTGADADLAAVDELRAQLAR